MTSSSRRDSMFSSNSSSFSTPHNQEKKQIERDEVGSPNKNHDHLMFGFLRNAHKNSIVSPRDIADTPCLGFDSIETITSKLPIVPVVRIVSKFCETAEAIGTTRTIIWKPGLNKYINFLLKT